MKKGLLIIILFVLVLPLIIAPTARSQTPGPDVGAFLPAYMSDMNAVNYPYEFPPEAITGPWNIPTFQNNSGHYLDIFLWYQDWREPGISSVNPDLPAIADGSWYQDQGHTIELAWEPHNLDSADPCFDPGHVDPETGKSIVSLQEMATSGSCYETEYIRPWAQSLATFTASLPPGVEVLFRPMSEMNGDWVDWGTTNYTSSNYENAWRHIHDVFVDEGATNVKWLWAPNRDGDTANAQNTFNNFYPAENICKGTDGQPNQSCVDIIGIDGYNFGCHFTQPPHEWTSSWQGLDQVIGPSYDVFTSQTDKEIMIAETGSPERNLSGCPGSSPTKASWITNTYTSWLPYRFPRVTRVTWFNHNKRDFVDFPVIKWRIDSVSDSATAFNGAMQVLYDRSYFMNHYNTSGANSWVMTANPASVNSSSAIAPNLYIGGVSKSSSPPAQINPNATPQIGFFSGLLAGPVQLTTHQLASQDPLIHNSTKAIMSQRILKGNSMEEVPSRDYANLSDHYYWPWYDNMGGFIDRIHISNLNPFPIFYEITLSSAGIRTVKDAGIIGANQKVDPQLPSNTQSGPLEVQTWVSELDGSGSQKKLAPAYCVPSQRVLYNNSTDFTEFHGVPAEELSDQYFWPWYDNASSGAADYVMIANPGGTANPGQTDINFTVKISGDTVASGNLPANQTTFRAIPATMGGPLEVIATDPYPDRPAPKVVVSQRTIWGPSFEEAGGVPNALLSDRNYWPWYDMSTAGVLDYVMIANPNANSAIYYELKWKGVSVKTGQLAPINSPSANAYDVFTAPGSVDGPIEVQAWFDQIGGSSPASVLTSQRVIWKGFFDEAMGAGTN
ncbi:MAG: glycoside hydrolase family 26 protein [Thermoleophilia bacterium]